MILPVRIALATLVLAFSTPAIAAPPAVPPAFTDAGPTTRYSFVSHAAFFSLRNRQPDLVDPEIFIASPSDPSATFDHLAHAPGIRNALMSDDGTQSARDANGRSLGVDLQHWFAASGSISFTPQSSLGGITTAAHFANLVPSGRYSLFVVHSESPEAMVPLDGSATTNSFVAAADGHGDITLVMPRRLQSNSIVELVFHSDGKDHGLETGAPAIDSESQLVLRVP